MASRSDFDFLFGNWRVEHRRARQPFGAEPTDWVEFETTTAAHPILDGWGNADDTSGTLPSGDWFSGHSLRLYDPETERWRIWWASTNRLGVLDEPVEGRFTDGVGEFLGPFEHEGSEVWARFQWTETDTDHPVWQQQFSFDGGRSWAPVNWIMRHVRLP